MIPEIKNFEGKNEAITIALLLAVSIAGGAAFNSASIEQGIESSIDIQNKRGIAEKASTFQNEIRDLYRGFYRKVMDAKEFEKSGSYPGIIKNPQGPIERIYRSNINVTKNPYGQPTTKVVINSKGLREEKFDRKPPENTTRILVIGDSYVYGSGVNVSQRYTDLLEKKLNRNSDRKYQVINAGIIGAGVKDYYLFLKNRGLSYNPDIVIIGVIGNDWMSLELEKRISRNTSQYISKNYPNASVEERNRLSSERFLDLQAKNQDLERYSVLKNISSLAANKDIDTIVFASDFMAVNKTKKVERYGDTENSTLIKAPHEFRDDWKSKFCLKYSPNRVSTIDRHPSPLGHKILADKLYREIADKTAPLAPWHYGGFTQWLDPC